MEFETARKKELGPAARCTQMDVGWVCIPQYVERAN